MRHLLILPLICLCLAGCTSFRPPARPVTGLFPTVVPMEVIDSLAPWQGTLEQLQDALRKALVWDDLKEAGFTHQELALLLRGLRSRGYAEVDCRRAPGKIRWVALTTCQEHRLSIVICYHSHRVIHIPISFPSAL